jgi:hypothetical protein
MAEKCPRCEDEHPLIRCPYVKAITFEDSTCLTIRRVEFLTPMDYGQRIIKEGETSLTETDYPKLKSV